MKVEVGPSFGTREVRMGEVDGAVGTDRDVVGLVEPAALESLRDRRNRAVGLDARHPTCLALGGKQSTLWVNGETVGEVARRADPRSCAR